MLYIHISSVAVDKLKPTGVGHLVCKPVYDPENSSYYFTYDGYAIACFINVGLTSKDKDVIEIIGVELDFLKDIGIVSPDEFTRLLVADLYWLQELFKQFPMYLSYDEIMRCQ